MAAALFVSPAASPPGITGRDTVMLRAGEAAPRGALPRAGEEDRVAEGRYIAQAERARRLIDKGIAAWQRFQTFAMANDELVDSVVLRGQELWLPHHETDGREFRVTLVISLHFPAAAIQAARAPVDGFLEALSQELSDEEGTLVVRAEAG
jgi:hypothetical protein